MGIFDFLKKKQTKEPKILGMIQVFGTMKGAGGFNRDVVVIDISTTKVVCLCMPLKTAYTLGSSVYKGIKLELTFVLPHTHEKIVVTGEVAKDPEKGEIFPETEVIHLDITRIQPKDREEIDLFVREQKDIILNAQKDKRRILMDSIKCNVDVTFSSESDFRISTGKIKRISSWGVLCEIPHTENTYPYGTVVDLVFSFLSGVVVRKCSMDWIACDHNHKTTFVAFRFRKLKYEERMLIIKFASVKRWHKLKSKSTDK